MTQAEPGIVDRLRRYFAEAAPAGLQSAYLFGSEAEDRAHRESDVDVAVLVDRSDYPGRPARTDLAIDIAANLVHVLKRNEVDVVVLNDAPPELGRKVVTAGERVHCADPEADHAYVRDVQLRAADLAPFLRRMRAIKLKRLQQ